MKRLVYLTRADIARAGDCSKPVTLDGYPGMWWLYTRPMFDARGSGSFATAYAQIHCEAR